jgi:hypothetical protein
MALLGKRILDGGNYRDFELSSLRQLLILARGRGFESLSGWAEIAMRWAEAASAEITRLRPGPGQARVEENAFVTASGRRYCLKHPAFELNEKGSCIRCQELEAWLRSSEQPRD